MVYGCLWIIMGYYWDKNGMMGYILVAELD